MKFGVVLFPGSNCERDTINALSTVAGGRVEELWHKQTDLPDPDVIILPGGFSYGDHLRAGAIARFSPIMKSVIKFAESGGVVIGICNGFQILMEAGLLPGAMLVNRELRFISRMVNLRVENPDTRFTNRFKPDQVIRMPIAHYEGNYYAPPEVINRLQDSNRIIFRYCDEKGNITPQSNPNGSISNIAGICNQAGNVLGMMPHFERAYQSILGSKDGKDLILSILEGAYV